MFKYYKIFKQPGHLLYSQDLGFSVRDVGKYKRKLEGIKKKTMEFLV
jgi:hypothetical protein